MGDLSAILIHSVPTTSSTCEQRAILLVRANEPSYKRRVCLHTLSLETHTLLMTEHSQPEVVSSV